MTTKVLIGAGIVWLLIVLVALCVPTDFVIGIRLRPQVSGATLLHLIRAALVFLPALFWIGWTLPLGIAAYRLVRGY
jgi:hypothetical protein